MAAEQVYVEPEDEWDDSWFDDRIWTPEPEIVEQPLVIRQKRKKLPRIPEVRPSDFTAFAFRMPREDEEGRIVIDNFSFEGRRHLRRIYDTPAKKLLLICGRQVEKSTLLGNIALCYMSLVQGYRVLYVSPSATQTKTFSNDRVKEPIETSPILKKFTTHMLSQNIFEKQFINRSKITMRYAFLNADRARGIPSYMLDVDELQDILGDNLPVLEECLSHAPDRWKRQVYSGTPKSLDNTIEQYRVKRSTQSEWVVPHNCRGGEGGRFWNILGEKNIGLKGLICENCGTLIDPMCDDAQWACMVYPSDKVDFESYRISQLMVPWVPWIDVLTKYRNYGRDRFYNEVLGLSYDSGLRPLTMQQVKDRCMDHITMSAVEAYRSRAYTTPVFAGIDWGTGEHSYTVVFLGTYVDMQFRVFFAHRFTGEETEPELQIKRIIELLRYFNVRLIGCDYGGGFAMNHRLIREFGADKVHQFQYLARTTGKKVQWDPKMGRWKIARTEVMSDIFNAIKRNKCEFPRWEEFEEPHGSDMLNIYSEYNEKLRMIQYDHSPDNPDDSFHAFLYCWLVSMLIIPRPDIVAPTKEDPRTGMPMQNFAGPVDQS